MDGPTLLFILRIVSALLLLAFLVAFAWFLQRDLVSVTDAQQEGELQLGFIEVVDGQQRQRHNLRSVISIGRIPSNTIVLDNAYTSAQHALITRRESQWWLEDLNSRNGTLLNNIPINEPAVITVGDDIAIGDVHLSLIV